MTKAITQEHASESTQHARDQLQHAGLRLTSSRVQVLAALIDAHSAMSHNDLQSTFKDMDRVTLYRALDCLTDAGLAHKIAGDDRVFRYSAGSDTAHSHHHHATQHQHGHFKCTHCSRVFCLDEADDNCLLENLLFPHAHKHAHTNPLQQALQDILGKGFESHEMELTIKGLCADCSGKH